MEDRIDKIRLIRPDLDIEYDPVSASVALVFQNEVLRPILKLQNALIMSIFIDHCLKKMINLGQLDSKQLEKKVRNIMSKEQRLKNQLIGMIIGMMTVEEHKYYLLNTKAVNKRMISMIRERILSQL
ncbi:hypothetical protein [Portibacter marinus]|uniref:hypothetical protein n=1 Tax=Portibacter marinus TaxID=2898660 RepID=UPI001F40612E|nr:hypothetical protein [Portibacter marinus]